jgi:hypothetical protein
MEIYRKYSIHDKQYDLHITEFNWRERFVRMKCFTTFGVKWPLSIHVIHEAAVVFLSQQPSLGPHLKKESHAKNLKNLFSSV